MHSGVEIRIVRKELASLARAGYDAHIVIPCTQADVDEMRGMGITATRLCDPSEGGSRMARMTTRALQAYRAARAIDAALYHFHDPELIPVGLALRMAGHKVVMDIHEDLEGQIMVKHWIRPGLRRMIANLTMGTAHFAARRFDGVVGAFPYVGEVFAPHARNLAVIRNFPLNTELPGLTQGMPFSQRKHVAYVGGISRIRGIMEVVDALPDAGVRLKLAGKWFTEAEHQQAMARPGWSQVDEMGYVDRNGIRDVLTSSFVGMCTLYPVQQHIFTEPIKMFEYMAAELPVIASNIPHWKDMVEKEGYGICVEPTDPKAIADAIRWFQTHPDEARRMGERGRAAVLDTFNFENEGRKLVKLYEQILEPAAA